VLENHSVDVPWWGDLVEGVEKPIVNKGFITVPAKTRARGDVERRSGEAAPAGTGLFRADAAVGQRQLQRRPLELGWCTHSCGALVRACCND
jgi:hypothetical protein